MCENLESTLITPFKKKRSELPDSSEMKMRVSEASSPEDSKRHIDSILCVLTPSCGPHVHCIHVHSPQHRYTNTGQLKRKDFLANQPNASYIKKDEIYTLKCLKKIEQKWNSLSSGWMQMITLISFILIGISKQHCEPKLLLWSLKTGTVVFRENHALCPSRRSVCVNGI